MYSNVSILWPESLKEYLTAKKKCQFFWTEFNKGPGPFRVAATSYWPWVLWLAWKCKLTRGQCSMQTRFIGRFMFKHKGDIKAGRDSTNRLSKRSWRFYEIWGGVSMPSWSLTCPTPHMVLRLLPGLVFCIAQLVLHITCWKWGVIYFCLPRNIIYFWYCVILGISRLEKSLKGKKGSFGVWEWVLFLLKTSELGRVTCGQGDLWSEMVTCLSWGRLDFLSPVFVWSHIHRILKSHLSAKIKCRITCSEN